MISTFQRDVAGVFFDLPASHPFVVAGGAALIVRQLVDRQTEDIDLFAAPSPTPAIEAAADAFLAAAGHHRWTVTVLQRTVTFARLMVAGPDETVLIDLAVDSAPAEPASQTELGPTLSPHDLAARKTLALFGRAEARDFTDVYDLARTFGADQLLSWAAEQDPGFDPDVFADMLRTISRYDDQDLEMSGASHTELRDFFAAWSERLAAHSDT